MSGSDHEPRPLAVPGGRLSRLVRFGGLASGVAGRMAVGGMRQAAQGQRPDMRNLLLTPANAAKLADQLSRMRGAAMKLGQLISMDAGEVLPPEFAEIFARLRSQAHYMPPRQLRTVLDQAWGPGWLRQFESFQTTPIASASIGQVHRARTRDGRDLAIKVQYPGVRRSIDSDVANVATLIRMTGLLPAGLDIAPLLDEARRQLHEEADYQREMAHLQAFGTLLQDEADYLLPTPYPDLTTRDVLAMSFIGGVPVESLTDAPQGVRDRVTAQLVDLVLRELFEFRLMQTDPNFANYRYDHDSGRVVLLDFGATRRFDPALANRYRHLLRAAVAGDRSMMTTAAEEIGYLGRSTSPRHKAALLDMIEMASLPLRQQGVFDFGRTDLARRLHEAGMALGADRSFAEIPPVDALFLQRKVAGIYLLAARLGARIDLRAAVDRFLDD